MSDRKDFVNFLLNKGADINLPLPSGKSLLACAISYKEDRTDMARYFSRSVLTISEKQILIRLDIYCQEELIPFQLKKMIIQSI